MLNVGLKSQGQFRLVVSKDRQCQHVTKDTGFFENMVLDSGFDTVCTRNIVIANADSNLFRYIEVGTGTTPVSAGQTALANARASASVFNMGSMSINYERGYWEYSVSTQFGEGAASGNLTEVALGVDADTFIFSRALITDAMGNPTALTVLGDEFLTVQYSYRVYMPKTDIEQSIIANIDGVPTPLDVTLRIHAGDRPAYTSETTPATILVAGGYAVGFRNESVLRPPTDTASGTATTTTFLHDAYVMGSARRTSRIRFGTNQAVGSGNQLLLYTYGPFRWQALFSQPIVKTNQQVLDIRVGIQYGRL